MPHIKEEEKAGLHKSLYFASLVLVFHVVLIVCMGCLILFFRGIVNYMTWIILGITALSILIVYLIYRRMRREKRTLGETLDSPVFRGRDVEVSLLGGLASVKIGNTSNPGAIHPALEVPRNQQVPQLEDTVSTRVRELTELAKLLEKDLITLDEYNKTKQEILNR